MTGPLVSLKRVFFVFTTKMSRVPPPPVWVKSEQGEVGPGPQSGGRYGDLSRSHLRSLCLRPGRVSRVGLCPSLSLSRPKTQLTPRKQISHEITIVVPSFFGLVSDIPVGFLSFFLLPGTSPPRLLGRGTLGVVHSHSFIIPI